MPESKLCCTNHQIHARGHAVIGETVWGVFFQGDTWCCMVDKVPVVILDCWTQESADRHLICVWFQTILVPLLLTFSGSNQDLHPTFSWLFINKHVAFSCFFPPLVRHELPLICFKFKANQNTSCVAPVDCSCHQGWPLREYRVSPSLSTGAKSDHRLSHAQHNCDKTNITPRKVRLANWMEHELRLWSHTTGLLGQSSHVLCLQQPHSPAWSWKISGNWTFRKTHISAYSYWHSFILSFYLAGYPFLYNNPFFYQHTSNFGSNLTRHIPHHFTTSNSWPPSNSASSQHSHLKFIYKLNSSLQQLDSQTSHIQPVSELSYTSISTSNHLQSIITMSSSRSSYSTSSKRENGSERYSTSSRRDSVQSQRTNPKPKPVIIHHATPTKDAPRTKHMDSSRWNWAGNTNMNRQGIARSFFGILTPTFDTTIWFTELILTYCDWLRLPQDGMDLTTAIKIHTRLYLYNKKEIYCFLTQVYIAVVQ